MKTLYLAGGCFWGLEAFLQWLPGVQETLCGYANGSGNAMPSYGEVCTGAYRFAETVRVSYDETVLRTEKLLEHFFRVIDPTAYHRQGNDCGVQYRSGIYCCDNDMIDIAKEYLSALQRQYSQPLQTEILPLMNFYPAEEYHQQYLKKNPGGYCHIDLRRALESIRFHSAVEGTLPEKNSPGLYVDAASGTPLFSWRDYEETIDEQILFCAPITSHSITIADADPLPRLICTNSSHPIGHFGADTMYHADKSSLAFIPADRLAECGYGDYCI